jgi:hypothetical protein
MATRQMYARRCQATLSVVAMESHKNKPTDHTIGDLVLSPKDLCDLEVYFREKGTSMFVYNEQLDIFCFPEDGRFAFCDEFADWKLLRERGYLDF